MQKLPKDKQRKLDLVTRKIALDDARCAYCGSLIYCTVNSRGYYVVACKECGALWHSDISPFYVYFRLKHDGGIITREQREEMIR